MSHTSTMLTSTPLKPSKSKRKNKSITYFDDVLPLARQTQPDSFKEEIFEEEEEQQQQQLDEEEEEEDLVEDLVEEEEPFEAENGREHDANRDEAEAELRWEREQLRQLTCLRDQLKNDVLAMAQNNLNSHMEMREARNQMVECMVEPLKLRRRIGRKLRHALRRDLGEHEQRLDSRLTQCRLSLSQTLAESQLDYRLLRQGDQFRNYGQFLDTFIGHRKQYHRHKAEAKQLTKDMEHVRSMHEFCRKFSH